MDLLGAIRFLLAVGVTVYAFLTYQKLKGGTVGKPYAVLTACGLVGVCSATADFLGLDTAHDLLGIIFYVLLFVGFMFLYKSDKLMQSLDRLRILMNSLPAFISYIGPQQRYAFANKLYTTFFGQKISQFREPHVREILGDQAYQKTRPHIEAALRGEQQSYEYELPHGSKIHHIKAAYVPDMEDGKVKGIFVFGIDITEQKKLEQDLLSANKRLEHIIKWNPAVLYIGKAPKDIPTYHSKTTVSITGFEPEELVGEKGDALWESRVHPDDLAPYLAATADFLKVGHRVGEYRFLHKNGTYRWIRDEANVTRDSKGNVQDIVGYWTDVTDRKRMDEELLKSNRLAAIGETAAMVGHDLRNPLQAMTSSLYLTKKLIESPKIEDRIQAVELVTDLNRQIQYMNKIVSDLQNYARPVSVEPVETNLKELIEDALSKIAVPENIQTNLTVKGAPTATTDPVLMRRVIVNLVTNAIQAMPDGGRVTVSYDRTPDAFSVIVQDTGVGIAPEDIPNLFTPFFTKKAKGQGLGLAVCRRLVEAQRGTITVESKLGQGSTFRVTMPMLKALEAC